MIVCHCRRVRADDIRTEVRLGADTLELVALRSGAATRCGGCQHAVAEVVADELRRAELGQLVGD